MAQSPWGELRVCDAHVHFFTHRFYSVLAQQKRLGRAEDLAPLLEWEIPDPKPALLASRWARELDAHGVDKACLIASVPPDEDGVSAAAAAHPARFFGYFMLDPLQPDASARIRAAAANPNLHCVCLFPAMHKYLLTDLRLAAVLELIAQSSLCVFVHCGALSVGVRRKLGLPSPFDLRFSNPLEIHAAALRYPETTFIVPHFGAGMFREALMLADLCPNVRIDTSSTNRWMAYEGLDLETVFRRSLDVAGAGRLLFGSDSSFFPRGWQSGVFQDQANALAEIGIGEDQARQIFGGNLEALHRDRSVTLSAAAH